MYSPRDIRLSKEESIQATSPYRQHHHDRDRQRLRQRHCEVRDISEIRIHFLYRYSEDIRPFEELGKIWRYISIRARNGQPMGAHTRT